MPKVNLVNKKEYKVIADGIISSFISRNNDVHGYWAIGKLYSLSESLKVNPIVINLIERTITPHADRFIPMINHFAQKLTNYQDKRGLPKEQLKNAQIFISCIKNHDISIYQSWAPHLVQCEIKMTFKNGTACTKVKSTRCRPHDPRRELKSSREYDE